MEKNLDVMRFSQYYVFGMDVYEEIASNKVMENFLTSILLAPDKFVLFASAPIKPFARLSAWLKRLQAEKGNGTWHLSSLFHAASRN